METESSPERARSILAGCFATSRISLRDLWFDYFALGGNAGRYEVEAYLEGLMPMSAHEHNVLAQAINERLADLPPPTRVPYRTLDEVAVQDRSHIDADGQLSAEEPNEE